MSPNGAQESGQARDKQSKTRLGKAKPGYAGQRADVGGALGVLGPEVQELGVQVRSRTGTGTGQGAGTGQYVAWGGKERHRGENRSLYIHNPPLPTWVTTYIRIYQYHDYQCQDSNRRF